MAKFMTVAEVYNQAIAMDMMRLHFAWYNELGTKMEICCPWYYQSMADFVDLNSRKKCWYVDAFGYYMVQQ